MLVLCTNCTNHYDDASQSEECAGVGRRASAGPTAAGSAHAIIASTPVEEHVHNTRRANR